MKSKLSQKVKIGVSEYIQLLKNQGIDIEQAYVFGSYAKGKNHEWSDVDVCLVARDFKDPFDVMGFLFSIAYQLKIMIEPHPYHPKDFTGRDPLVSEIKKTGIKII